MTKTETYGYVNDGKLHLINERRLKEDLSHFKNCDVQITIKKKGKRSSQQNRYYFGVVVHEIRIRLNDLGHRFEPEDVHEYLKQRFNGEKIIVASTGELLEFGKSTTEMNKEEFSEYVERIRQWASETLEITIPDPNTQTEMFAA